METKRQGWRDERGERGQDKLLKVQGKNAGFNLKAAGSR